MTTRVADVRDRLFALRLGASADAIALGALGGLTVLLAALTWGTWGDLGVDTGYDVVAGARVAEGDLPYADFVYYYGPLGPMLAGLAAVIGGDGLLPAIVLGLVITLLIVAGVYALARQMAGPVGAFLAAAITAAIAFAPTNFSFVLPHSYSATLGALSALGLLLAALRHAQVGGRRWLVLAGAAVGVSALTRPEFALAAVLGIAVWLLLRWRAGLGGPREIGLAALPAVLIPAAVYGAFLAVVSPGDLLWKNLYPVDELADAGNNVLRIHAPLTASSFGELALKLVIYAAGVAGLVLLARAISGGGRLGRAAVAATAVGVLAVAAAAIARPETARFYLKYAYGWIPAGVAVAVVVLVWRYRRRGGEGWAPLAQADLLLAIVLGVLAAKTYAVFFLHSPAPQPAVYAVPLAAVFLARLHLAELARSRAMAALGATWLAFLACLGVGLALKDARAESATVRGPGGSIAELPAEAPVFQGAVDAIVAATRPGDPILLAPQLTTLHTLTGRPGALQQISLLPGALPSAADERAVIDRLERSGVRLAIVDRQEYRSYGHGAFGETFDRLLAQYLRERFALVDTLTADGTGRTLDVWLRRTS